MNVKILPQTCEKFMVAALFEIPGLVNLSPTIAMLNMVTAL